MEWFKVTTIWTTSKPQSIAYILLSCTGLVVDKDNGVFKVMRWTGQTAIWLYHGWFVMLSDEEILSRYWQWSRCSSCRSRPEEIGCRDRPHYPWCSVYKSDSPACSFFFLSIYPDVYTIRELHTNPAAFFPPQTSWIPFPQQGAHCIPFPLPHWDDREKEALGIKKKENI